MSFFAELRRRNVVRVGIAYIVIGWLLAQVAEFAFENFGAPEWVLKSFIVVILLGLPLALFFAWAFEITPEGVKREKDVDRSQSITQLTGRKLDFVIIGALVLALGYFLWERQALVDQVDTSAETASVEPEEVAPDTSGRTAIAVLPFVAMSASRDDEFFADGLSEELLNVLAKIEGLKVAGRTSAFYYKGKNEDLRTIADALGVTHILEGSVRRSGSQIRVTAQLIQAEDGFHLWSETYDRADGDVFLIQDEISSSVARALKTEILGTPSRPAVINEKSVEAQNIYLVAQAALAQRNLPDVRRARDLYAQASILDPSNPKYLAGFATAVALQYWNFRDITADEATSEAGEAIEKALNLEDPSADTLAVAGLVQELHALTANDQRAKEQALVYYQQAIEKDPNNILALQWLASIYLDINEPALARENFQKVVDLDPLNVLSLTGLSQASFGLGFYDEARSHLFKMQSLFPELGMIYRYLSNIEYSSGRLDKGNFWINRAAETDPNPFEIYGTIIGYIVFGWADEALAAAERYRQTSDDIDISRLVQARLDLDFATVSTEASLLFEQVGDETFAGLSAWADSIIDRCDAAIETLERQYPSLKGETIEYLDTGDRINAVLLAHCNSVTGNNQEAERLIGALLASGLISKEIAQTNRELALTRIAAHAVVGDVTQALSELEEIDAQNMPLAITEAALPVDKLPVFSALYDEELFQKYAMQERYEIARQARLLAAGETQQEIQAEVNAAGYVLSN
jgi:TolB-like protein